MPGRVCAVDNGCVRGQLDIGQQVFIMLVYTGISHLQKEDTNEKVVRAYNFCVGCYGWM